MGNQKLSMKPTKAPLSQQNTIERRTMNRTNQQQHKIQAKLERDLNKLDMSSGVSRFSLL